MGAAAPRRAGGPRLLVRGRRPRPLVGGSAPHRGRVGEGGDLGPGDAHGAAIPVGRRAAGARRRSRQPRPHRPRPHAGRRAPGGRLALRRARDARRRLGVDGLGLRPLPRLRRPPLPRVLRGVLRPGLQGAARRVVGHPRPRRDALLPQLGPPAAAPDLLRRPAGVGRMTGVGAPRVRVDSHLGAGSSRTLAEDVLDGLTRPAKELAPKHFYDARGSELFERICELPEYYPTRAERAILEARADDIVAATGAGELVELGSGSAIKTRVLLDAMARAGPLRRYVPFDVAEGVVRDVAEALATDYPGLEVHGVAGDFERPLARLPGPTPAPRAPPRPPAGRGLRGGDPRQLPARQPPPLPARAGRAARPRRPPAARHGPRQGSARAGGGLRRRRRRDGRVQPQPAARHPPRARGGVRSRPLRPRRVLRPRTGVDRDAAACASRAPGVDRGDRPRGGVRPRRGAADGDLGQVHAGARAGRPRGRRARAHELDDRRRGALRALAQPESTGSSAPSLTSVSASSAAGSESRTTPTPA